MTSNKGTAAPVTRADVDLSNCDREQIQFAGAIQPHGLLLVLTEPDLVIRQVSANVSGPFGAPAEALVGRPLAALLKAPDLSRLQARLARDRLEEGACHLLRAAFAGARQAHHVFGHRIDGVLVLELEPASEAVPGTDLYAEVQSTLRQLQATPSLEAFFDLAVQRIRELTGYDRVLAYRFAPDGSGEVIAEAIAAGRPPYLGLNYPASDIPAPARRLFALRWVSHLPDADCAPVPLVPVAHPLTGAPLDLTHAFLRSMSVMYTGYLKNMGVRSTMVLTLMKGGRLWGLVSCMHHDVPRHVPFEVRTACEFLAHVVSLLMAAKEDAASYEYRLRLNVVLDQLLHKLSRGGDLHHGLVTGEPDVLAAIDAPGAAVLVDGRVSRLGAAPSTAELETIARWLASRDETVFSTDRLSELNPSFAGFRERASGLLAMRLSPVRPEFVMWFRPEQAQTVHWAGDPGKPVEVSDVAGAVRLLPRTSFDLWKQSVEGRSRSWTEVEVRHAQDLRRALVEVVLHRAEAMRRINQELEQSNIELAACAYVASHDLKEPLRGIHNFAQFLCEDEADRLSTEGRERLEAIIRLTRRMDELIESLLHYSRVGRMDLQVVPMDTDALVREVLRELAPRLEASGAQVDVRGTLPVVHADRVRLREIFSNLVTNACKYNDKATKQVEISAERGDDGPVFCVRDNGIGIEARHQETIFQIFKRLHRRDQYGGGAGAGLTIARRSVERHAGRIWVESQPGVGSTFRFTLPAPPADGAGGGAP